MLICVCYNPLNENRRFVFNWLSALEFIEAIRQMYQNRNRNAIFLFRRHISSEFDLNIMNCISHSYHFYRKKSVQIGKNLALKKRYVRLQCVHIQTQRLTCSSTHTRPQPQTTRALTRSETCGSNPKQWVDSDGYGVITVSFVSS